jgi:hypothetical protein
MGTKGMLVVGIVLIGVGWWVYHSRAQATSRSAATTQLASVLCDRGTLAKVVDAYPQSHMSRDGLGAQTLGEGLGRLSEFRSVLPSLVDPIVPELKSDPRAWAYMADVAKRTRSPQLLSDRSLRQGVEDFTQGVAAAMRSSCPTQFQNAGMDKFGEFGIGAILGDLGRRID